jgi:hypothetical protein
MRALVTVAASLVLVTGAAARPDVLPQQQGRVELGSQANVTIVGAASSEGAGDAVAGLGDVNRDGIGDLVVGAPGARNNGRANSGSAYVVFGRETPGAIDLSALGAGGFRIDGAAANDRTGYAVAGLGDVDGDGRADVLVGAQAADPAGRSNAGSAYVVFGKESRTPVDLLALGNQGFRIDGAGNTDRAGWAVAAAGDVNGDGRPDALVGASFADNNGRSGSGSAYVVFGKASAETVDLALPGEWGFRIDGGEAQDFTAEAITGAGDVNGDGLGDVVVGATFADPGGLENAGSVYVVYGKRSSESIDLAALGAQGFRIDGAAAGDGTGAALAADDLDGDGRADLLVGSVFADANARQGSGSVHVLLGPTTGGDLGSVGAALRIDGAAALDFAGGSVAAAGDANGDGRADVLVGAAGVDGGGEDAGAAYVVFLPAPSVVDLGAFGQQGYRMAGVARGDAAGGSVAGGSDVNGDARPDTLVGAALADAAGRVGSGSAYVVYGFGRPGLAYAPLVATAGRPVRAHAPRVLRRTGPARFSASPRLPPGLRLDPRTGAVSGTPVTFARRSAYTVTMRDLAGSARSPLVIAVRDARPPGLKLAGSLTQRPLRTGAVEIAASCDEPCRLTASGRIVARAAGAEIVLTSARASPVLGTSSRLRLALAPAGRRRLTRLLDEAVRATAIVSVRAIDGAGNARAATRTIRVLR